MGVGPTLEASTVPREPRRRGPWKRIVGALVGVAVTADILFNFLFVCRGEWRTVSSCWAEWRQRSPIARAGCAALDLVDPGHCDRALR